MITSLVIKKHNLKEKRELFRAVYANFAGCSGQLFLIFSNKFPLIAIVRLWFFNRELKQKRRARLRKRHSKKEFAFFQTFNLSHEWS